MTYHENLVCLSTKFQDGGLHKTQPGGPRGNGVTQAWVRFQRQPNYFFEKGSRN